MVRDKDIQDLKRRAGITEQSHRYEQALQLINKANEMTGHAHRTLTDVYRHIKSQYPGDFQTELDEIDTAIGALADVDSMLFGLENNLPE